MFYKSCFVYFIFLTISFAFRLVFLAFYNEFSLQVFYIGLRLDMAFCGVLTSVYVVFALMGRFVAKIIYDVLLFALLVGEFVFMVFFKIYHKNIDKTLSLLFVENPVKLFDTMIKSNYGVIPSLITFLFLFVVFVKIYEKIPKNDKKIYMLICFVVLVASVNYKPFYTLRQIDFKSSVLQASAYGHMKGLLDYIRVQTYEGDFQSFEVGKPKDVACQVFKISPCEGSIDLYKYLERIKTDDKKLKPKKIYYIIHESLSDWVFEPRFADMFSDLHEFIKNGKATYIKALHNASNTKESFWVQMLNTYYNHYDNFKIGTKSYRIKTNIVDNFKALGYHTNFFYGSEPNWAGSATLLELLRARYYDEISISKPWDLHNTWGFYDDVVYDFLDSKADDFSLNIMITVTNHPPYDLSFAKHSFIKLPYKKAKKLSQKYEKELITQYWSQKVMIDWIKKKALAEPDSLFVITGDHYGRYNIDDSDDLVATNTVPVIIYSPIAKIYPTCTITNHVDIMPSIIELIAPKGHKYHSFGRPCFNLEKQSLKDELKIGLNIAYKNGKFYKDDELENKLRALSWYLIYKGSIIK